MSFIQNRWLLKLLYSRVCREIRPTARATSRHAIIRGCDKTRCVFDFRYSMSNTERGCIPQRLRIKQSDEDITFRITMRCRDQPFIIHSQAGYNKTIFILGIFGQGVWRFGFERPWPFRSLFVHLPLTGNDFPRIYLTPSSSLRTQRYYDRSCLIMARH